MSASFFFYDLETSGISPRQSRVMQFAGQRTDLNLNPIGEPYNILIKLSEDILPEPGAVLLTGITPQQTLADGITEAEFCKLFMEDIVQPDTCFVGFNTIRFDDEFMRFLLYRNFYDPYAWQWKNGCSRWDLLDVSRMTRALRPGTIKWPFDDQGKCTNRLELITKENGLNHEAAHDALSDVTATIAVADLIKTRQPKLFDYLYSIRGKREVTSFLSKEQAFVYTSGRYSSDYLKTTIGYNLGPHPSKQGVLVYNLRHDPTPFLKMDAKELAEAWRYTKNKDALKLPVKAMQLNRAPALAPLGVLDAESTERLKIDMKQIAQHQRLIKDNGDFYERLRDAADYLNKTRNDQEQVFAELENPDEQLYEKFIPDSDRVVSDKITAAKPGELTSLGQQLSDSRLQAIVPLYKARNYPKYLNDEEREVWEEHRKHVLLSGGGDSKLARFTKELQELSQSRTDSNSQYLIQELQLYAESIVPEF